MLFILLLLNDFFVNILFVDVSYGNTLMILTERNLCWSFGFYERVMF